MVRWILVALLLFVGCWESAEEKYQECMKAAAETNGPHDFTRTVWTERLCREASGIDPRSQRGKRSFRQ